MGSKTLKGLVSSLKDYITELEDKQALAKKDTKNPEKVKEKAKERAAELRRSKTLHRFLAALSSEKKE